MLKKKKICFIINTLSKGGGAERTIENLSSYYYDNNFDITIILIDKYVVGYTFDNSINIITLNFKKDKNIFRVINELGKLLRIEKFDYIFSFLFRANIINILTSLIFNIRPIVISERSFSKHNYSKGRILKHIIRIFLRYFYSKSDKIIAISDGVKESLIEDMKVKTSIDVIYNPVILSKNSSHIKTLSSINIYKFITIGRLIESKNQKLLIDVIEILTKRNINVVLTIIGDGELKKELQNYVQSKCLEENVVFLGYVERPELYLQDSHMFLFASKYEAFGNVILEAMREGLPIVSFKSEGGPTEILKNGSYGVVIEEFSPIQMADEIIDLISDAKKYSRFSRLSIERVNNFSVDRIAKEYLQAYDNSLKKDRM